MNSRLTPYWVIFVLVHLWAFWLALTSSGYPLGDVTIVYLPWSEQAMNGGSIVGINQPWVYPILALLPMIPPLAFGHELYAVGWLVMCSVLNAIAYAVLLGNGRSLGRKRAAVWWMAFIVVLGPIVMGRIDAVTVPMAIVALLIISRHPMVASIILSIATWMKIWPAAAIGAAILVLRQRVKILVGGIYTTLVVLVAALFIGGFPNVLSFITQQTGRGIQVEAPVAVPYLWIASLGGNAKVYYDRDILTYQVRGDGVDVLTAVMTPLLVLVVALIAVLAWRAQRSRTSALRILPVLVLALVTAMIAVNKVGSPQFMVWFIAPIVFGLVVSAERFRFPAVLVLVLGLLTQLFYPYLYGSLLRTELWAVITITLRNIGTLVLLVWCVRELWRLGAPHVLPSAETRAAAAQAAATPIIKES
ncbi:glycosyltransferase family 87 protein [Mycetocola sp. JXN-3]|uniref:glycosyltransferase family 87 protein n=1 Tax=Mycetocola sp. JXN-3 TaxID=2116510 RepID=UPI00165D1B32|nr:glycosyltransferase family 87 protein [Mycetocola sp. JXN-3]